MGSLQLSQTAWNVLFAAPELSLPARHANALNVPPVSMTMIWTRRQRVLVAHRELIARERTFQTVLRTVKVKRAAAHLQIASATQEQAGQTADPV